VVVRDATNSAILRKQEQQKSRRIENIIRTNREKKNETESLSGANNKKSSSKSKKKKNEKETSRERSRDSTFRSFLTTACRFAALTYQARE